MNYIRIKKLAAISNPASPTPDKESFKPGQDNGPVSLPVDYEIEGNLKYPIEQGRQVLVDRTKRNGVVMPGFFATSPVTSMSDTHFTTLNSQYEYEFISPNSAL
jgi:hypothetical protein